MKQHRSPRHASGGASTCSPARSGAGGGAGNADRARNLRERVARSEAGDALPHRQRLEERMGVDLSGVEVALGTEEAASLLDDTGAEALAWGGRLLFAERRPDLQLVAHEVAHLVQQGAVSTQGGGPEVALGRGAGEGEAEEVGRAVAQGGEARVSGTVDQGPQLSTGGGSSAGSVSLVLDGGALSPPSFPGGLSQLHGWLMEHQAELAGYSGKLRVIVEGKVRQSEQVIWSYYHPQQTLFIVGRGGAEVNGFQGSGSSRSATPGYFLSYRPIISQEMSAQAPAKANFSMQGLTVRGFVSGGVELSPRSGALPGAAEWAAGGLDPEEGHYQGGASAFISGAKVKDNVFAQMGTHYLPEGQERYNPSSADAYKYAGYGGVVARGVVKGTFEGNTFSHLENRNSRTRREDNGGKVNWRGLMHGIYLRDRSSDNAVLGNDFRDISGAAVKFTHASHRNKVRGNSADRCGNGAFVLDHYNPNRADGVVEQDSRGYGPSGIGRAADGRRYLEDNHLGSTWAGWGRSRDMELFEEKRVGG